MICGASIIRKLYWIFFEADEDLLLLISSAWALQSLPARLSNDEECIEALKVRAQQISLNEKCSLCSWCLKASMDLFFIVFSQDIAIWLQIRAIGEVFKLLEFENYPLECRTLAQMLTYKSCWSIWISCQSTNKSSQLTWRE